MSEFFEPLDLSQIAGAPDLSQIAGAPHAILNDAINNLPPFQGNNAISFKSHLQKFSRHLVGYCNQAAHDQDDIKMKLFVLSLEENVGE